MTHFKSIAIAIFGAVALGFGVIQTALASSGYCKGTVYITGGGSGGGIVCTNVNCTSACMINTQFVGSVTMKWCYCDGGTETPQCCHIRWAFDPDSGLHDSIHHGSCVVLEEPCPLAGTCTEQQNGPARTAECVK